MTSRFRRLARRDRHPSAGRAMAGWTGTGMVALLMLAVALGIVLFERPIAWLYSADAAILAIPRGFPARRASRARTDNRVKEY